MDKILVFLLFMMASAGPAFNQNPIPVADQTIKVSGEHSFAYAFAEGDKVHLRFEVLVGREIKEVYFVQIPSNAIFKAYEVDSLLEKSIEIPKTGIYKLVFSEEGLGKKICRFTLDRMPASEATRRFETHINWDIDQYPQFSIKKTKIEAGKKTEVVSLGGRTVVSASKMGLKKSVGEYQFSLPPNTVRWAYRISVGQATAEARQRDSEKLAKALQSGSIKLLGVEPTSALAAFALGMAIDFTIPTGGEDIGYQLVDELNAKKFRNGQTTHPIIEQTAVSLDAQRLYAPLNGKLFFVLRNDNWMDDVNITIEIEAVTEVPIYTENIAIEPVKP